MAQKATEYPVWIRILAPAAVAVCLVAGTVQAEAVKAQILEINEMQNEPVTEFVLVYIDAIYGVRLMDSAGTVGGDLTVSRIDTASPAGAPKRVAAVADFLCNNEARFFNAAAVTRKSADGTAWTFVEGCH